MRNVAASYLLCSCRANAVQQSGNPAAAAPPSNAQVSSFPTHPTLRHSARAPRPCLPLLLPASLPSPARLHNVCAPRATPRKPALARSPLPHASTPRPVALALPSLPRPACPRTSARPSVAISSSPLPPSVQAHAPPGLGPSRAHSFSPSPRMPAHFSSALGCQIILDPARPPSLHAHAPQGLGPSRAHLFSPPPPLQAEAMRALTGVLQPTRRLGHSGGDGPAAGARPARSSRVAADQPARATAALVLAEDDEDNAPLFRERSWKRGRKTRYSA